MKKETIQKNFDLINKVHSILNNKIRLDIRHYQYISQYLYQMRQSLETEQEKRVYQRLKDIIQNKAFYRLEKKGIGPWYNFRKDNPKDPEFWITGNKKRIGLDRCSSGVGDVWFYNKEKYIHACYSLDNLKSWFCPKEWQSLMKSGYTVKKYYLYKDFNDLFFCDNQVLLLKPDYNVQIIKNNALIKRKKEIEADKQFEEHLLF